MTVCGYCGTKLNYSPGLQSWAAVSYADALCGEAPDSVHVAVPPALLRAFALIKEDPTLPVEVALRLAPHSTLPLVPPLEMLRYAAAGYAVEQT